MESMEAKVNLNQIENDFKKGLVNAEMENATPNSEASGPVSTKLPVNVPNIAARFLCDFKNKIATNIITKEMDDEDKEFVREFLRTTPKEIELYKRLFDIGATELTPEEYKAFLNKWLCNPIIIALEIAIEHELQRLFHLRNELKRRSMDKKAAA